LPARGDRRGSSLPGVEPADRQGRREGVMRRPHPLTTRYSALTTLRPLSYLEECARAYDIQGRRLAASVQLVQALGGGWCAGELPTSSDLAAGAPKFRSACDGGVLATRRGS